LVDLLLGAAVVPSTGNTIELDDIVLITKWGERMKNDDKIPSVISYSRSSPAGEKQWGNDLSPEAICMVHQKLELGIGTASNELDFLLKTMEGVDGLNFDNLKLVAPIPEYPTYLPEQIVTDYIEYAFGAVIDFINQKYTSSVIETTPVDVVITMPAVSVAPLAYLPR
jgi:hypothetical protein